MMSGLFVGIVASLIASLIVLVIANREDVRYLLTSPRAHKHLEVVWHQYHLTYDSTWGDAPIWMGNVENLRVTIFGRVYGESFCPYNQVRYRVSGHIRQGLMRLRYHNTTTHEADIVMCFPNLMHANKLMGMWMGTDFDRHWCSGPIVLSRQELSTTQLDSMVRNRQRIIGSEEARRAVAHSALQDLSNVQEDLFNDSNPPKIRSAVSSTAPGGLLFAGEPRGIGVVLIALVGLIHLLVALEYYGFAPYLGLLMIANLMGSVASAIGIHKQQEWGWWLGVVIAGGTIAAYVVSRTLGLPGLSPGEQFMELPGLISLVVEASFIGVATPVLARWKKKGRASASS